MVFRPFFITIVVLAILLATLPLAGIWVWQHSYMIVTKVSIAALWVAVLAFLIYYINKTNRDLAQFFEAFRYQDSTLTFKGKNSPKSLTQLHASLNSVLNAFSAIQVEREKESIFLRRTIEHSGSGMLALSSDGKVLLCNSALLKMLNLPALTHASTLQAQAPSLYNLLLEIKAGQQRLHTLSINGEFRKMAIKATDFMMENSYIKLLSFQDIHNEVDEAELIAWQKLIRVLRHEINNSISPITLVSSGLIKLYEADNTGSTIAEQTIKGLQAIQKRSKGLSAFLEHYRSITQLPRPNFQQVSVKKMLEQVQMLMQPLAKEQGVALQIHIEREDIALLADEQLMEQVLLNLTKNALEAVNGLPSPLVTISANQQADGTTIEVSDNGNGVANEDLEQIFTPFFTTKEHGTGIGLSLSRQIVRMHGGSLTLRSEPGKGATFSVKV